MKTVKVRCWNIQTFSAEKGTVVHLLITYPEENMGYRLVLCNNCGQIYAVDVSKEVYVGPPLEQKLSNIRCIKCDISLVGNTLEYPDNYISDNGEVGRFERGSQMPNEDESVIIELPSVYD